MKITTDYQTSNEFPTYLWFCSHWSNFQTPFLLSLEISDDCAEQDEMRPVLLAILDQYRFDQSLGTIITPAAFYDWQALNQQLSEIKERHAAVWLANYNENAA